MWLEFKAEQYLCIVELIIYGYVLASERTSMQSMSNDTNEWFYFNFLFRPAKAKWKLKNVSGNWKAKTTATKFFFLYWWPQLSAWPSGKRVIR